VVAGDIEMDDLRITPDALLAQAEIARAAGRPTLAANFERAAEMVKVPQELIMETYELLRPGRAKDKEQLMSAARRLRDEFGAEALAAFLDEAAEVYERRGLFRFRY
jgi:propanediol dehydratase small subunit